MITLGPKARTEEEKAKDASKEKSTRKRKASREAKSSSLHKHFCQFCKTPYFAPENADITWFCDECNSPLNSVHSFQINEEAQRAFERIRAQGRVVSYSFWPEEPHPAMIQDISIKGMQIKTAQALDEDSVIKLDTEVVKAVAKVKRCLHDDGLYTVGVEFPTVDFIQSRGTFVSTRA